MIRRKVCLLGAFAVGKTSLVRRYVEGIFSERYLTTIGVKIDQRDVPVGEETVRLVIWDLAGEDAFHTVRTRYLRGAHGVLLVADGTRAETADVARDLWSRAVRELGPVPAVVAVNKKDRREEWEIAADRFRDLGLLVLETSALTGEGVEDAFAILARRTVER